MRNLNLLIAALLFVTSYSGADERSGPGRRTLIREGWGTVFFAPDQIKGDYELTINENGDLYTFKTGQGTVVIEEKSEDVTLRFPDFEGSVDFEPDTLTVTWGAAVHTFRREGSTMTYDGPQGRVDFSTSEREMTITGPRGAVELAHLPGVYVVKSPAGETRLETLPSGFRVSGVRLSEHPYLRRGAVFSHNGIGIYVELALLDPKNPLFRLMEWNTLIELESSGP